MFSSSTTTVSPHESSLSEPSSTEGLMTPSPSVGGFFIINKSLFPLSHLSHSTVCKPRSPRTADPPPAFSSTSLLGGGLSELDHLLQELNATQFNITGLCVCVCVQLWAEFFLQSDTVLLLSDEILAQFPSSKKDEKDKIKDKATTPTSRY